MIQEVSEIAEEISFFEALAQVVKKSNLRQSEIVKQSNIRLQEEREKQTDPFWKALLELLPALDKSTLSRAVRGIDSISYLTLYRISLGLGLDQDTFQWLESLRKLEDSVHHSTTQQRIVVLTTGGATTKQPQAEDDDLPPWIHQ